MSHSSQNHFYEKYGLLLRRPGDFIEPNWGLSIGRFSYSIAPEGYRLGLRNRSPLPHHSKTNRLRILVLGSSSSWGINLNDKETWPACLEYFLNAYNLNCETEVLNFGVGGASLRVIRDYYSSELWKYKADIVILESGNNDFRRKEFHKNETAKTLVEKIESCVEKSPESLGFILPLTAIYEDIESLMPQMQNASLDQNKKLIKNHIIDNFDDIHKKREPRITHSGLDATVDEYLKNMRLLKSLISHTGSAPICFLLEWPAFTDMSQNDSKELAAYFVAKSHLSAYAYKEHADFVHKILRLSTMQTNTPLISLRKKLRREHYMDVLHTKPSGSRIIAEHIGRELLKIILQ